MTPDDIAAAFKADADTLRRAARQAVVETTRDLQRDAERRSYGTVSADALRRLGHPFARRHGTPLMDPRVINRQSGVFAKSWRREIHGYKGSIYNVAPHGAFLEYGTRRMFDRPVWEDIEENAVDRLADAFSNALEP